MIISVGFAGGQGGTAFARTYNWQNGPRIHARSRDEITALSDRLELMPPGIVNAAVWPESARTGRADMIAAGVARRN